MKGSLRSVLEQWTLYRRASEEISGYLMEGRYSVCRLGVLNGSLEAVQQQVESLEVSRSQRAGPPGRRQRNSEKLTCVCVLHSRTCRRKWTSRRAA